ncbi:hypothetical protein [Pseudomonas aeruginosa]|uniref:hypothetical protein n=1 Tax=Pseudomonas aeruginosa TaxID=287 RepID=UPI003967FEB0
MTKANECTCPSGDGSLVHPCPAHPAVEQAGANVGHGHVFPRADGVKMRCGGPGLCSECTADASRARATLAQPSPASDLDPFNLAPHAGAFNEAPAEALKPEPAEVERPDVVEVAFVLRNIGAMDAKDIDGDNVDLRFEDAEGRDTGCDVSIVEYAEKAADLLEQHDRIVGELRAEIAMLRSYESEWELLLNEHEQQRDAALAEVERLRQFERICEGLPQDAIDGGWTVQGIRGYAKRLEDQLKVALARVAELEHSQSFQRDIDYSVLSEYAYKHRLHFNNLCAVVRSALIALPAQAQHSVPEEFSFEYRHPNGECHTVTVSREQVINEMPDFLFEALCSKFCNCEPVGETNVVECCCDEYAEEFKLIAAAPGKEGV